MNRRDFLRCVGAGAAMTALPRWLRAADSATTTLPNIVYVLCDDLGYGDVQCLNPAGKIATPHIDTLASGGMIFTDAHSGSSVCTPSRYGILTGRYAWRTRLQKGVLDGYSPPLIDAHRITVASLLKQRGYATACVGKWHLGMKVPKKTTALQIEDGPVTRGFDYFYGISASLDMPPFAFIENDHFTQAPTATKKWLRSGAAAPDFEAINVLPALTHKAVEYIQSHAAESKRGKPFFLYLPFNSPHTPIVPTDEWKRKSKLNAYADFVMETDGALGEVLTALEKNGLTENTLVIFTSDNGCSPLADLPTLAAKGHHPSYVFRGYKADIWDGGHRIPFICRWPAKIKAGTKSDQLVCLNDLFATCAAITGEKIPDNAGEDSVSILPALLGQAAAPLREAVVHHSIDGVFSIRQGNWKLELCAGSGGWSRPRDADATKQGLPDVQLYDMNGDVGEKTNQQATHPDIVARLQRLLEKYITEGRSTPGRPQTNDVPVQIGKKPVKTRRNTEVVAD